MKLSVIVPIYNAEKYLGMCLDSIRSQTYQDFEAVLVDDGSTDDSGSICDRFVAEDGRFRVIHKKNEGLICARREGIAVAEGEFIAFVDADDWIDTDFFETMLFQVQQETAGIVAAGCIKEYGGRSETVRNKIAAGVYDDVALRQEVYPRMLHYEGFYEFGILQYVWNKIYKKELLESCYKDIDTRIYDGEDVAVVYPCLLRTSRAVVTGDAKYHYRIHADSMTACRKEDFYENTARLYLYLASEFRKTAHFECMMPQLDQYMRMMVWQGNPGGFIDSMKFIFPFSEVSQGAAIVLYGAGYVGQIFYRQITLSGYCTIAAWVDRSHGREALRRKGVVGMEALQTVEYDYVVIAVQDQSLAAEIASQLVSCGTDREKIIFCAH